jgi:hypothetical protein
VREGQGGASRERGKRGSESGGGVVDDLDQPEPKKKKKAATDADAQQGPGSSNPPPLTPQTHLMVAPDQVDGGRLLNLEGQQQADGLQGVGAPVDIIAQEKVVDVCDVAGRAGGAVLLEQAHEVSELAVEVAEDLDGG